MKKLIEPGSLSLISLFAIAGVGFAVAGIVYTPPAVEDEAFVEEEAPQSSSCEAQMEQIVTALHAYHDKYESFPPAFVADTEGKPLHSWRVLILPFIDKQELYDAYKFDQAWDGPDNKQLLGRMPEVFRCADDEMLGPTTTSYAAIIGDHTAWHGAKATKRQKMKDDPKYSIMLVQASQSEIPWMSPRDIEFSKMGLTFRSEKEQSISNAKGEGGLAAMLDGTVTTIAADIPKGELRNLLDVNDGLPKPPEEEKKTEASKTDSAKSDSAKTPVAKTTPGKTSEEKTTPTKNATTKTEVGKAKD